MADILTQLSVDLVSVMCKHKNKMSSCLPKGATAVASQKICP